MREQFNQRFNAYAPAWEDRHAPAARSRTYADVLARLQAAWPTPAHAMGVLEPLLFRQGTSEPVFDLAAYREVLFLYEVARDLAEHASRPSTVDLELPLDDAPSVVSYPMHNTVPVTPSAHVARPLLVDVDLGPDEPQPSPAARPLSAARRPAIQSLASRSSAASSVSSFLAKQKRTMRCSKPSP